MFKLNAKFGADSWLHSLSPFECDGHTVHMLTQQPLLPPLTSTVTSSLFTHAHFSPLSLAAGLHQCCSNHSHYINNGWTLSRQTLCRYVSNGRQHVMGERSWTWSKMDPRFRFQFPHLLTKSLPSLSFSFLSIKRG